MATSFKTPGVYIQEISKLPASIAPVETAIPAFVGYTETASDNGDPVTNKPIRITSLLEYEEIFGGPYDEKFTVTLSGEGDTIANTTITVSPTLEDYMDPLNANRVSPYVLYYHVQMFFENGGGPCYIVSVGAYTDYPWTIDDAALDTGLDKLEEEDEPTLLVIPEAISLGDSPRRSLYDAMLAQCNKLQDRFAILDVKEVANNTVKQDGDDFRDNNVSLDYLKYGGAYYPSLKTAIVTNYENTDVTIADNRTGTGVNLYTETDHSLDTILNGEAQAAATGTITINAAASLAGTGATITIDGDVYTEGIEWSATGNKTANRDSLFDAMDGATGATYTVEKSGLYDIIITYGTVGPSGNSIDFTLDFNTNNAGSNKVLITGDGFLEGGDFANSPNTLLYNAITTELERYKVKLYPSGTMAGIYARVDTDRGVWKAPANVSVKNIVAPNVMVTAEEQESLNIDATSGKSINAIRTFAGKGTLVWGARTLAGNDNEWRYVPVRRLYIFIEESVKKATEFVVFEPNDANTWLRVKTMIENFLSGLWKEGALAGAKPEEAYFVNIGLGVTMTAQDILEGRMIVEIGLAAVRPAEFIVLKFMHKIQES